MGKKIPYHFINEEDVLKRLGGNLDLFNRLFGKFMISYCSVDIDIQQMIDNKDYDGARLLAHTVKGTSANLGITPIWNSAALLEQSIVMKEEVIIEKRMTEFSHILAEIVAEVGKN